MPLRRLVLASASVARRRVLRNAGFEPDVVVSGVREDDIDLTSPGHAVEALAIRKATAVATRIADDTRQPPALVVACDSMLDVDGVAYGKPTSKVEAVERWQALRGRDGVLRTGHCVIDLAPTAATDRRPHLSAVASTVVHFGHPTDDEIACYVGTGEPLGVAGAFTLDGRSGPFIDGIDGDPSNVIGISLPLLRDVVGQLGLSITDLWA